MSVALHAYLFVILHSAIDNSMSLITVGEATSTAAMVHLLRSKLLLLLSVAYLCKTNQMLARTGIGTRRRLAADRGPLQRYRRTGRGRGLTMSLAATTYISLGNNLMPNEGTSNSFVSHGQSIALYHQCLGKRRMLQGMSHLIMQIRLRPLIQAIPLPTTDGYDCEIPGDT